MEIWCAQFQVSKRDSRDHVAERRCQDETSQDNSAQHTRVFTWQFKVTVNELSKGWRNSYV